MTGLYLPLERSVQSCHHHYLSVVGPFFAEGNDVLEELAFINGHDVKRGHLGVQFFQSVHFRGFLVDSESELRLPIVG